MNLAEIFIRRPIATTLVMLGIVIFGLLGYQLLPISDLPKVDFPSIVVNANLPGASPETMASSVATPLEKQFSSIAGINSLNSTSSLGSAQVVMQFDLSRNIDSAAQDVESAINAAAGQLPPMPKPPTYRKTNPTAAPILYMYLYSDTLPISDVDEYAEVTVGLPISMVNGVAQVLVFGSQQYAVRVQLDPQELATR
ncbi:MAG: efflux RND transporter permease subunit, partial [Chroococcidiopsidaceae cyanobacterium CP_BM_RX_35]|nr:efflux RND transporter permease subunit [Chroococcidiopsidaceae cyanobacterium CP_BM_RX_35]